MFLGDLITFLPLLHLLFLLFLFRMCEEIIHFSNAASLLILSRISSLLLFPSFSLFLSFEVVLGLSLPFDLRSIL